MILVDFDLSSINAGHYGTTQHDHYGSSKNLCASSGLCDLSCLLKNVGRTEMPGSLKADLNAIIRAK